MPSVLAFSKCHYVSSTMGWRFLFITCAHTGPNCRLMTHSHLQEGKDQVCSHAISCSLSSLITSAFESVMESNLLPQDAGPLCHLTFHSLPSPGFPRYPFIHQPVWEDEQLGELCIICPNPGSNSGHRFIVRRVNH